MTPFFYKSLLICFFLSVLFWPHSVSHKIETIRFISLKESVSRRKEFLINYNNSKIEHVLPLWQRATKPKIGRGSLSVGETGVYMSHKRALKAISRYSGDNWHLICEDDATGKFTLLSDMLKHVEINYGMPSIHLINLYTPRKSVRKYASRGFGTRLTAYLVTPTGARLALKTLTKANFKLPVDMVLAKSAEVFWHSIYVNGIISPSGAKSTLGHKT